MLVQEVQSVTQQIPSDTNSNTGVVVRTGPGVYLVRSGDLVWDCKLRGRLRAKRERLSDISVCVGDHVLLDRMQPAHVGLGKGEVAGTALISEILPRRTSLSRLAPPPWPGATRIAQVLAVNIDLVVVVVAAVAPPLKITTIDRFLLLARQAGIEPAVCINKVDQAETDLAEAGAADRECRDGRTSARRTGDAVLRDDTSLLRAREVVLTIKASLEARGVTTLLASANTGQGIEELRTLLQGKTSVFVGHSGVGKTSLLKRICPGLEGKTLSVNVVTGKGRHSTTFSSLIDVGGGYVADLPGLRSIGFWNLEEETVKSEFEDVEEIAGGCRFNDCSHTHEPGCAVKRAVEAGELDEARYDEYVKVMGESLNGKRSRRLT
jgi:ribosome biogenesis GTPase